MVILCECVRLDDDLVAVCDVLSRVASASDFTFCFIASVASTNHLETIFRVFKFTEDQPFEPFSFIFLGEKFFESFSIFGIG